MGLGVSNTIVVSQVSRVVLRKIGVAASKNEAMKVYTWVKHAYINSIGEMFMMNMSRYFCVHLIFTTFF
jgi:hypothetical protein